MKHSFFSWLKATDMAVLFAVSLISIPCSFLIGYTVATIQNADDIAAYQLYYQGAEELLDSIDTRISIADAYDIEAYYDGYAAVNRK